MKLFGTDGLRGRAGVFPLDPRSLRLLGREVGESVRREGGERVVLGGDWIMRRGARLTGDQQDGACVLSLPSLAPNEERTLKLLAR